MIFEIRNYQTLRSAVDALCEFLSSENVPEERIFDSKLVAYELLGNVLKHSEGGASLHGALKNGFVELKLIAQTPFIPPKTAQCADIHAEHGRGIYLVDSLCAQRYITEDGHLLVRIKIK